MPAKDWFTHFFEGTPSHLWSKFATTEMTEAEALFFMDVLKLERGNQVLDVPSGGGRHAIAIALRGMDVTGVDISQEMIRKSTPHVSSNLRFERHDMRSLPYENQFDAAYCAGNSFGYFEPDDTLCFLQSVSKALKTGGRFLIDTSLAAETYLVTGGVKEWVEVDDTIMLIENHYVALQSRLDSNLTFLRNGAVERRTASHYVHTAGEMVRMLSSVGLTAVDSYSTTGGDPFELGCERLFLISEKH
jgi:SAM-dependent methyltransferase